MIQQLNKKKNIYYGVFFFAAVALIMSVVGNSRGRSALHAIDSPESLYGYSEAAVFFGRDSCPACEAAQNILEPVLRDENKTLLYFNTDSWRDHELFEKILLDFQIEEVPVMVRIKNGECVERILLFDDQGRMDLERIKEMYSSQ